MTSALRRLLDSYVSGWSLAQPFYLDEAIFSAELDHIWRRAWLYVGASCEIPEPGDFFTYALHSDSLVVVRGRDGRIHAHHNTCRHRGSIVCLEERGRTKAFRCPYHQWMYDLDGALISARLMPEDFDRSAHSLGRAHVRVVGGLIFVSLAETAPDFSQLERDFSAYLAPFEMEKAKPAHRARYDLNTNWKLIAENFRECYHCGVAHPEYCRAVIGASLAESAGPELSRKAPLWRERGLALAEARPAPGSAHGAIRYPLRPGFVSYSLDGSPLCRPMGRHADYEAGVVGMLLFPGFWMDALADHVWTMRVTPVGPARTIVDATWFVDGDAQEGLDYDIERLTEFWRITGGQDWTLCENNFRGVASTAYRPGPYAPAEKEVSGFVDWYVAEMRQALAASSEKDKRHETV